LPDEWRSYFGLSDRNFRHKTIKHKDHFVDPKDREIYTENRWGQIKSMMRKRGKILRDSFEATLKEYVWRIGNK